MNESITRAIRWLDTVTDPDGGVHRWLNLETGELGPVSTEITGYAAHLFAWLALETKDGNYGERARKHATWIERLFNRNDLTFLPFEPGSDLSYFFDCGIASRGVAMVAKLHPRFAQAALDINEPMWRFGAASPGFDPIIDRYGKRAIPNPGWWSSERGHYQSKAILALDDEFNTITHFDYGPWQEWNGDGNLLHPMAYFVEAAYLSGNKLIAAMGTELLSNLYARAELRRCDVLAQLSRLQNLQRRKPLFTSLEVDLLSEYQHESGGFHFAITDTNACKCGGCETNYGERVKSPDLSTHATIFAIQALMMAEGHTTDYKELTIV